MSQVIEVPNYGPVEFPDDTPETEIAGAIRKNVYGLAPLPEMPEYDPQKYSDRQLVSKSNLQTAGEEGAKRLKAFEEMSQAAKAGQVQVSEEDVLKARQDLNLARDRYDVAAREWATVQKDPAPLGKSFEASVAKGALNTAAAAMENWQPVWQGGDKAFDPAKQKEYDALRTYVKELGPPKPDEDYETTVDRQNIVRQLGQLETPRESTLAGKLAGAAEESAAFYGVNPNAPNTAAQIGRGAGTFATVLPSMLLGGAGLPVAVAQMGGQTYESTYTQKAKELRAAGEDNDLLIDEAAQNFATAQAVKEVPALAAYLAGGKLASGVVAKILPEASPVLKGLAGTAAATGANVAVGGALRKFSGEDFLPTVEQLTQDALFGVVHGVGEGRKALSEKQPITEEPTNAEQISETSAPDGGVRPRGEVPIVPPEEGGTGVQPSGQGERLAEGPRGPSPQEIVPAIRVEGEVVRGQPGETHQDVLNRFMKERPELEAEALVSFDTKENPNFFVDAGGNEISRTELKDQFGVSDSQGLRELQAKTKPPELMTPEEWTSSGKKKGTQSHTLIPAIKAGKPVNASLWEEVLSGKPEKSDGASVDYVREGDVFRPVDLTKNPDSMPVEEFAFYIDSLIDKTPSGVGSHISLFFDPEGRSLEEQFGSPEKRAEAEASFSKAKEAIQNRFGDNVILYRAESVGDAPRNIFSYSFSRKIAERHARGTKRKVIEEKVPTDAIVWADNKGGEQEVLVDRRVTQKRKLGPGAANIEEFPAQTTVGAKNASVDAQRAERGLPPLMSEGRKANPETWAAVERRVETDPEYPARIVNEIENGERKSVTDEDQAALLWRMVDLRNQRDVADQRAQDEQTYSPEERAAYEEQANGIESELQRTEEADRKIGTKSARALQIRKIMANEDFTLAAMERRTRASKGRELTLDERAELKKESEEIQSTGTGFEKRKSELEEEHVSGLVDESIRDIEIEASKNPEFTPEVKSLADRIIARLDKMADAALKRLREKGFALGSSPDPTIAIDVAIYGAAKIGKGVVKFSRWAAEMVKELGEGVKPYLQEAWQSANKNIDDQIAGTKTKQPKEVKAAVTKENAVATAEEIGAKMKAKGGKLTAMRGDIQKLVETLVRGGVKGRDAIVDAVHEVLKQVDPSITRRQTMDAISGYGDFKQLSKDAIKAEVRDIKQQLQLVAKIQDIQTRIPLQKSGVERQRLSDESRRLTAELNENIKKFGVRITDPETQLRTMLAATETRLTNRIKDLKAEIAAGERRVKTKTPTPTNEKIEALRKELAEVQAEHKKVLGEIKQTEEQRLNIYKKALQRRTKDLQDRIAKGDFEKRPRKELDISKDPEAVRLKAENERVKKEFVKARFEDEQRKRTTLRKGIDVVKETLAASRSLITSADVSAPLRQGGFLLIGDLFFHPIRVAKQLGTMFHQLVSEKGFQRAQAAISLRPNADLYQQSKLYFSDMDGNLSAREENMRSTLAERIPAVGRIVRASNRAYSGFLNRQRADAFDAMIEARGGKSAVTPEGAKLMADAVNTLTGRGSIGATNEGAANFLARYLFSPRFLASRFQTVLGKPILGALGKGASLADRRVIAKQYAKFAIGLGAIYGLAQLAGAKVEKDPRSSDFGKLRFGNTRVDPLAGLAQVTVLMARTATGKTKAQGELKPVTADTYYQFARSKLAPVPGALLDLRTGKNVVGEKTTLGSVAQSLTVPLSYQDAGKIFQAHGPFAGTVLTVLNLLGAGTQHYKR